jgi:hypothetical protein
MKRARCAGDSFADSKTVRSMTTQSVSTAPAAPAAAAALLPVALPGERSDPAPEVDDVAMAPAPLLALVVDAAPSSAYERVARSAAAPRLEAEPAGEITADASDEREAARETAADVAGRLGTPEPPPPPRPLSESESLSTTP